ncbi:MAG: 2-C-methyl-D-erythritol 4-phosphate cytidylyltransferase, partial [Micavibrio sp.]|nr:2-C-methyl-D-erythritol 4-phosphate cytidylyltransferase [Micavibrio sp.]
MTHNNTDIPQFHVIIPAGGNGSRMSASHPKQYLKINNKTVLEHTLTLFERLENCLSIMVAIGADDAYSFQETSKSFIKAHSCHGGKTRKESVYNALKSISDIKDEDIILVHDSARPCVTDQEISELLTALSNTRAATLATPITSTLRKSSSGNIAGDSVARDDLWSIQTPQAFRYGDLLRAHETSANDATDDSQLVSSIGIPVKLVQGSTRNIKITYPEDLEITKAFMTQNTETRIGQGFDAHAFDENKKGPVRLCGIDVPHTHALKGHSDADVGLHTLTDAIYGALGAGDIGVHFPPSDMTFKDMDSAIFLEKAIELMHSRGGKLINADVTIICEAPKISP